MKWFKMSTSTYDGLSMKMMRAKYPADYYRNTAVMTHLMALAGRMDANGELRNADGAPLTTIEIAILFGLPEQDIADAIAQMADTGIEIMDQADDGAYRFSAWGRYQERSRAEYQRERRAAKRADDEEDDRVETMFNTWWAIYPRKVAKAEAAKAWKKAAKDGVNMGAVIAATQDLLDDPTYSPFHGDKTYIPYPATWLRGNRYEEVQL